MTDPFESDLADDFRDADWSSDIDVRDDFVERTLERVITDRLEIEAEAAQVDDNPFPQDLLDALEAPEPSADFTERTAREVFRDRDAHWARVLDNYAAPRPNDEFVERTLSALRIDRSGLRVVETDAADDDAAEAQAPILRPAWQRVAVAAAALVFVSLGVIAMQSSDEPERPELSPALATQTYTPATWSTAMSLVANEAEDDIAFQPMSAFAFPPGGDR